MLKDTVWMRLLHFYVINMTCLSVCHLLLVRRITIFLASDSSSCNGMTNWIRFDFFCWLDLLGKWADASASTNGHSVRKCEKVKCNFMRTKKSLFILMIEKRLPTTIIFIHCRWASSAYKNIGKIRSFDHQNAKSLVNWQLREEKRIEYHKNFNRW